MKRVFISLLVLAITSTAGAEIMFSIDGVTGIDEYTMSVSDTFTLGLYNAGSGAETIDFDAYICFYDVYDGKYSLSNDRLGPAAGDFPASHDRYIIDDGEQSFEEIYVQQAWAMGSTEITPGDIFLVDFHMEMTSVDVYIELWDSRMGYMTPADTLIIHEVPEPATLLLFGFGGLILRRRRP